MLTLTPDQTSTPQSPWPESIILLLCRIPMLLLFAGLVKLGVVVDQEEKDNVDRLTTSRESLRKIAVEG